MEDERDKEGRSSAARVAVGKGGRGGLLGKTHESRAIYTVCSSLWSRGAAHPEWLPLAEIRYSGSKSETMVCRIWIKETIA